MKIFPFLLSLFFMVLTLVPCSDDSNGLGNKICLAEDIHLEQGQNPHADLCTPFCVCNCCGMSMTVTQVIKLLPEKIALTVKDSLPDRNYNFVILHPAGIWQPPKIG